MNLSIIIKRDDLDHLNFSKTSYDNESLALCTSPSILNIFFQDKDNMGLG